jgi:hypothetical protein
MMIPYRLLVRLSIFSFCLIHWHNQAISQATKDVTLEITPVVETATLGVPVVIKLEVRNKSAIDQSVYYQTGEDRSQCKWVTKDHSERVLEYVGIIPWLKKSYAKVLLKPGESRQWSAAIPTPNARGEDLDWTLEMKSEIAEGDERTVKCDFRLRFNERRKILLGLCSKDVQLSLMGGEEGGSNLKFLRSQSFKKDCWDMVTSLNDRDEITDLILFAEALEDRRDILETWRRVDRYTEEIRCLRDYLFIAHRRGRGEGWFGSKEQVDAMYGEIRRNGWFTDEIQRDPEPMFSRK